MARTSGQNLGSLIIPLFLLAILAGVLAGAGFGAIYGLFLALPMAANPGTSPGESPGAWAVIPIIYGIPAGGIAAVVPALGSLAGLFIQARKVPLPSIREQSLAAGAGASTAAALVAVAALFLRDANPLAVLAFGVAFTVLSYFGACLVAVRFLRHRAARYAAPTPAT